MREIKKAFLAAVLFAALPALAAAQFCPSCIQNTAAPQNAIINIGTATIRGSLTASTGTFTYFYTTNMTASQFVGGGVGLTGLNASNLGSGTVPSARVSGAYTGITSVGTLGAGTWNGTAIGTQYGGTGQNFVNVGAGSIVYFSGTGTMATLAGGTPEALLQTNGAGAPVWTSSPAVSGLNIYGINPYQLAGGSLPTNVIVSSNSIPYVNAASVFGVLNATATYFTGTVQLSQLAAGTLSSSVVASSITGTGISAGTYGDSSHALQIKYGTDGRASTITVLNLSIPLSDLQSGTLASGVLVPAANVQAGVLGGSVVASSVAASGVAPGTYGGPSSIPQFTVGGDGRITSVSAISFSGPISGTGTTGFDAIWSSTYQVTNGLLYEHLSQVNVSTNSGVFLYGPTGIIVTQSSVTAASFDGDASNLVYQGALANEIPFFTTNGSTLTTSSGLSYDPVHQRLGIRTLNPLHGIDCSSCTLYLDGNSPNPIEVGNNGSTMTLTSAGNLTIAGALALGSPLTPTYGGTGQNWSAVTTGAFPYFTGTGALGTRAAGTNGYTLTMSGGVPVWAAASSSATYLAGGTAGALPYQSAPNVTTFLAASVNGYALQLAGGVPSWVAAVSSASNIAGGAVGAVPYQSAANTTALLAAGTQNYVLQANGAGAPSWVAAASSATNLAGGAANGIPYQTAANATTFLAQGSGVLQETAGAPGWTTTPTLTGTNITGLVAANILAGTLGPSVIASSVAATAVTAGSYGSASSVGTFTTAGDGRLTAAGSTSIQIAESQVTSLVADIAARASTGTVASISTMVIVNNGVGAGAYVNGLYPNADIISVGNINGAYQRVSQNLSNGTNATSDWVLTNDLGGNTSYYLDIFINSSKYSQTAYSAEKSSATGIASSDSDVMVWAGVNGGLNNAASERVVFGSSNPVAANIAMEILPATASGPGAIVALSSMSVMSTSGFLSSGTIQSQSGFNVNGTAGASITCSGGNYLNSQVVTGGIITGGSCTAAGAGNVVLASTQTFSGSNTFGGAGITTTTFQDFVNFSTASGSGASAIPYYSSATANQFPYSTTSSGLTYFVPGSTLTINCQGMDIEMYLNGVGNNSSAITEFIPFMDGLYEPWASTGIGTMRQAISSYAITIPGFPIIWHNMPAGNHSATLLVYTNGAGTSAGTIFQEELRCVH